MICIYRTGAALCYVPVIPPGSIRGPHPQRFFPYPVNLGAPMLPPETLALKANIVKQIEYYFRYSSTLYHIFGLMLFAVISVLNCILLIRAKIILFVMGLQQNVLLLI